MKRVKLTQDVVEEFINNPENVKPFMLEMARGDVTTLGHIYAILKRDDRFKNEFKPVITLILSSLKNPSESEKERIMRTLTLLTPILGEYTNNAKRIVEKRAVKVAYQKRPDYEMLLNQTGLYPLHKGNLEPFVTMDQDHVNFVMDVFEHDLESDSPCTLEPRWSTTS